MQLGGFGTQIFDPFSNYKIDDPGFFLTAMNRMIEGIDTIIWFFASTEAHTVIDAKSVIGALSRIDFRAERATSEGHYEAVVRPSTVQDFARAPLFHTEDAISAMSRYLNFYLVDTLRKAATDASLDPSLQRDSPLIKLRHLVPYCEDLPYPLNLYLC